MKILMSTIILAGGLIAQDAKVAPKPTEDTPQSKLEAAQKELEALRKDNQKLVLLANDYEQQARSCNINFTNFKADAQANAPKK